MTGWKVNTMGRRSHADNYRFIQRSRAYNDKRAELGRGCERTFSSITCSTSKILKSERV